MLFKLSHTVSVDLISNAAQFLSEEFKETINTPTGDPFYDPWIIKDTLKDSVWDKILQTLPHPIGEARIITLKPASCYAIHADIDDRYHLNISGNKSYLVDLHNDTMYPLLCDKHWYSLDAGKLHSAVNFGRIPRIQLVVRKLLNPIILKNPVKIKIISNITNMDIARFEFDQTISCWLNQANKNNIISHFRYTGSEVSFQVECDQLSVLDSIAGQNFNVIKL